MFQTKILGTGHYVPPRIMTNDEISQMVDTSHQWIVERTGIHERRIADPKVDIPSEMAHKAALKALEAANLVPNDIDLILFSTTFPDMFFPNTATQLQLKLGITNGCGCLDMNAACTGFMYAFTLADGLIRSGMYKKIMVVGAEMTSGFNNWKDRNTCILFGDGCGVTILGAAPQGETSTVLAHVLGADATKGEHLMLRGGGAAIPINESNVGTDVQCVVMDGKEVFKSAVKTMAMHCEQLLEASNTTMDQIDWFIPHQANLRIIEAVANRFHFPLERAIVNVNKYANTSSATVPIAMDEAIRNGRIQRGQKLMLAAFGAGLTSGGILLEY
jgi:3-oxoacyl-[acyl-carrier-protein] synthase III